MKKKIQKENEDDDFCSDFIKGWEKLSLSCVKSENNKIDTYIFDSKKIRYKRNQNRLSNDEFILIDRGSNKQTHFFTSTVKEKKYSTQSLNFHNNKGWEIAYKIETNKEILKRILGIDCHQVIIKEKKKKETSEDEYVYELYVTEEFDLPLHVISTIAQNIFLGTALEIKEVNLKIPKSFTIKRAIELKKNISNRTLKIPDYFDDATEVEYVNLNSLKYGI